MTAQTPDVLIYEGDRLSLFSNPLEAYYGDDIPRPPSSHPIQPTGADTSPPGKSIRTPST